MKRDCFTEAPTMTKRNQVQDFLHEAGDFITSKQLTEAGLHRGVLSELVKKKKLARVSRGVYIKPTAWEDEMFILQYRYGKGIFSHETALYLQGMSDRTPSHFTMTFPWGYNVASLKDEAIKAKLAVKELYEIGIARLLSPVGNIIRSYDIERTLCDIVRGNYACDISIVNQAMKSYAASKGKDIQKLMGYAEKLRVKSKILRYMEVLL
jgi:predicted transcriptional regulator of viral defense system